MALLLIAGEATFLLQGQTLERGGLKSLTLSHGLSDLLVNTIYKDKEGYVWFGTESSVDRFDGNQILRFPIPGDKQKSRRVLCFAETQYGTLYVGTNQGLYSIQRGARELKPVLHDKINKAVSCLALNSGDVLYIGTTSGLYIYNFSKNTLDHRFLVSDNMSERNSIKGMWLENDEVLWLLTFHRLWKMNLRTYSSVYYELPVNVGATRLIESGKTLYIGTDGSGVLPFSLESASFGNLITAGNDIVTSLSATPGKELIIGTDGDGVYKYSTSQGKIVAHLTSSKASEMQLRSNSVYSVLKDNKGLLWIGYYQSGVDYTPYHGYEPEMIPFPADIAMPQNMVRSIDKGDGYTVIGTHDGLILIVDSTGKARRFATPEIASNLVMTIKKKGSDFYVGTYHGGLYKLNPATAELKQIGPPDSNRESVFALTLDPAGDLWAATSSGLYRFKDDNGLTFDKFTSHNSPLPAGNVYEIFFDSLGRGWIGTENGMAVWNGQYIQATGFPEGFVDKMKIRVVYEDSDHHLYFAPDRGVLHRSDLSLQNTEAFSRSGDERFSQILAIKEDKKGWIWLGTDKGLIRFDKKNPDFFHVFNHIGGVTNPMYTLAKPYEDRQGVLWFGSTSGLHKIDIDSIDKQKNSVKVSPLVVSEIESGGKSLTNLKKEGEKEYIITLKKDQKDLWIHVTDFNYEYRDYFEVEYKIEDKDGKNEWKWANGAEGIKLNEIPDDDFILLIRIAGEPESQIRLKIEKSKQFPWWWIAGGILLILFGISAYYYHRHKNEIKRLRQAQEESQKRSVEKNEEPKETDEKVAYRTTRLSDEECKRLYKKLDNIMKLEKPFKNPDLKIKDLGAMIGSNSHSLSFLFNQYLEKSYYDYVNEWRVREFKEMVKTTDISKYTLSTLAEKCGFSSRASFFRHFKTLTGMTPAEYLKKQKEGD